MRLTRAGVSILSENRRRDHLRGGKKSSLASRRLSLDNAAFAHLLFSLSFSLFLNRGSGFRNVVSRCLFVSASSDRSVTSPSTRAAVTLHCRKLRASYVRAYAKPLRSVMSRFIAMIEFQTRVRLRSLSFARILCSGIVSNVARRPFRFNDSDVDA